MEHHLDGSSAGFGTVTMAAQSYLQEAFVGFCKQNKESIPHVFSERLLAHILPAPSLAHAGLFAYKMHINGRLVPHFSKSHVKG